MKNLRKQSLEIRNKIKERLNEIAKDNGYEFWETYNDLYRKKGGYEVMIIADHGNADNAVNEDGSENTAHTLNPVPCVFVTERKGIDIENGILADVAPTLLSAMGLEVPADMTGKNLIK